MRSVHRQLFFGSLLLFAVLFKGVGGYSDLYWYMEDTIHLWTRGSMLMTPAEAALSGGRPYHRFAPGLSLVSGPFVFAGELLHRIDAGISVEFVVTLIIPLAAATAVVLLFMILLRLGSSPVDAVWSAAVFAFASPFLSYTRLYYVEIVIVALLFLAVWCWLNAVDCADRKLDSRALVYWTLAGLALTGVMVCHYIALMTVLGLAITWTLSEFFKPDRKLKPTLARVVLFFTPMAVGGLLLLLQNYLRYGSPFVTGYNLEYGASPIFSISAIPGNVVEVLRLFARTPWAAAAVIALFVLYQSRPILAKSVVLACILQHAVWLNFVEFSRFSTRYDLPDLALLTLGLPLVAAFLRKKFPQRGLQYALVILVTINLFLVLRGDDWSPPFQMEDAGVSALLWYRRGRYIGACEWAILFMLFLGGIALMIRAANCAKRLSESGDSHEGAAFSRAGEAPK